MKGRFDDLIDEESIDFTTGQAKVKSHKKPGSNVKLADSEEGITQEHAADIVARVVNNKR